MYRDIINELKLFQKNKKYINNDFILMVCNYLINYYELNDYVKSICINNDVNGYNSRYLFNSNILELNLFKYTNIRYFNDLKDNYHTIFNLLVLKTIIHEIEHARQEKIKDTKINSIERKLLLLGDPDTYISLPTNNLFSLAKYRFAWIKFHYYYDHYYYSAPNERLAIIKSCIDTKKILETDFIKESIIYKKFNTYNEEDLDTILCNKYHLNGDVTNSPSLDYLEKLTKKNHVFILNDKSLYNYELDSDMRLLYGLSLTKEEYFNMSDIKKELIKKI